MRSANYAHRRCFLILGKAMKAIITAFIFLLLVHPAVFSAQVGSPAPPFSLKDLKGNTVDLSSFEGKVVFLDFWAPWCTPCKEELPALEGLYRIYNREGLEIIAVAVDSSEQSVSRFLQRIAVSYQVVLDNRVVSEAYRCSHMPTGYIIGREGILRYIHKGFGKDSLHIYEKEIVELLKRH
jgi:thiol-disulfide isomerase/thioredoxin